MPVKFTILGRIVIGSPTFVQKTDMQGNPKDKPNIFMAVAVEKSRCTDVMGMIFTDAMGYYRNNPRVAPQISAGLAGKFAWKIDDGDAPNHKGKEGYAGCYIFKLSTTFESIPCYDRENRPMDPTHIKRGYYVQVHITCQPNELPDINAGVYLNPDMVRFAAFGPEIVSGPSVEEAFGAAPPPVPQGGSLTPFASGAQPQAQGFQGQPPVQFQPPAQGFGPAQLSGPQVQPQGFQGQANANPQAQGFGNPFDSATQGNPQAQGFGHANVPVVREQTNGGNAGWAGHGQPTATAYPGNPQTFPGT